MASTLSAWGIDVGVSSLKAIKLRREGDKIGFYRKRSHDIVDIEHCVVAQPGINEALRNLRAQTQTDTRQKIELAVDIEGSVSEIRNQAHAALGFQQINAEQNKKT